MPEVGKPAPKAKVTTVGLEDVSWDAKDMAGKRKVLNIFPSIDTSVCALSVRLRQVFRRFCMRYLKAHPPIA